ncbi:hypothetical protein U9R90_27005 [Streptomyces sp. E11-3]|uniref:hypothetical protein n=1 Tax=Streptomyces sp. E11-3 TaxID=3110112 RepID=UPI0039807ADF
MPAQPFTISSRAHLNRYDDGHGGGQADHVRTINGRLFYFERFWNAEGYAAIRVRALVPNPAPGNAEGWETIHELTTY